MWYKNTCYIRFWHYAQPFSLRIPFPGSFWLKRRYVLGRRKVCPQKREEISVADMQVLEAFTGGVQVASSWVKGLFSWQIFLLNNGFCYNYKTIPYIHPITQCLLNACYVAETEFNSQISLKHVTKTLALAQLARCYLIYGLDCIYSERTGFIHNVWSFSSLSPSLPGGTRKRERGRGCQFGARLCMRLKHILCSASCKSLGSPQTHSLEQLAWFPTS